LSKKRMAVVTNLLLDGKKAEHEAALDYFKEDKIPGSTIVVVFEAGMPDKRTGLFKFLAKQKFAEAFEALSDAKLEAWIDKKVQAEGGTIDPAARRLLVQTVGADLWALSQEIYKLAAYANKKPITIEAVHALVHPPLEEDIFRLVDAVGAKRRHEALSLLRQQKELGASEQYLLAMIVFQFRNLVQIVPYVEQRLQAAQIAKKTKMHPFVVNKTMRQARTFTTERLRSIYNKLSDIDIKIKTGQLDPDVALDLLIVELTR